MHNRECIVCKQTHDTKQRIHKLFACLWVLCQGCCLAGTQSPSGTCDLPTGDQNFKQGRLKLMILKPTSSKWTTKFLAYSALVKQKWKKFDHKAIAGWYCK